MCSVKRDDMPSDELNELLTKAREGSREAYLTLVSRYTPLILSMLTAVPVHDLTAQETEDLREEAERKLLDAVYTYDMTQNEVTFGLYAKVCIHNALVSELRRIEAARRVTVIPLEELDALDDHTLTGLSAGDDPARVAAERERYEELCRRIRTELSPLENRIWWAYLSGQTVGEIAASMKRSEKSVHNAVYRIRCKLRRALAESEKN